MKAALLLVALAATSPQKRANAPMMIAPGKGESGPLIFARENVFISADAKVTAPDESGTASEKRKYYFDTDIKPEESLTVDWFYSLQGMRSGRATLVVLKEASPIALPEARLYKPVDILVIGDEGTILAVMPKIVLATLEKQVKLDLPVKALMYIAGGEAETLGIAPKDRLIHRLFKADPVVIQ